MANVLRYALQATLTVGLTATIAASSSAAPPPNGAGTMSTSEQIAKARELFLQAQADETRGDYLSAFEKFERVAETKNTASVRFHLGYCSEKLGRLASALQNYTIALREAEREGNADVKRAANAAAEALAPRVPHLTILCPPDLPSCAVRLDGRLLSTAELSVFLVVDPGTHHVSAQPQGPSSLSFEADVVLHERESRTVHVTLAPPSYLQGPSGAAPRKATAPSADSGNATERATQGSDTRTGAWLATGGALALTAFGLGSFFGAAGAQDSLKDACITQPSCDDEKSSVRVWDTVALASFISAGALAVVATVLFVQPKATGRTTTSAVPQYFTQLLGAAPGRVAGGVSF